MPDLKMSTVTKFAVAVESDSSGRVDWFDRPAGAVRAYCDAIGDRQLLDNEVNLFTFSVAAGAQRHEIDNAADQAMWHRSYTPIRWRTGSAHSALAHSSAPTDPTV